MTKIILLISLLFLAFTALSQDSLQQEQHYIVLYTLGESWDLEKSPQEQTHFKEHSAHLSKLRSDGLINVGGRYSGTGMLLLKAENEDAANELIKSDIAIKNGLFKVEIFLFSPFYKGCVE